jgi:hypothetical protein
LAVTPAVWVRNGAVELWKLLLIVVAAAGLVSRVMSVWPGLPPKYHWKLRAKVLVWVVFASATAFFSAVIYMLWILREEAAA